MTDYLSEVVSGLVGLAGGLILGWNGHRLARKRAKEERQAADELRTIERCIEMFGAQVRYVIAADTPTPDKDELRRAYHRIYWDWWWARPEVILRGVDEWDAYKVAEKRGLDRSVPVKERIADIKRTASVVSDLLVKRRESLLK